MSFASFTSLHTAREGRRTAREREMGRRVREPMKCSRMEGRQQAKEAVESGRGSKCSKRDDRAVTAGDGRRNETPSRAEADLTLSLFLPLHSSYSTPLHPLVAPLPVLASAFVLLPLLRPSLSLHRSPLTSRPLRTPRSFGPGSRRHAPAVDAPTTSSSSAADATEGGETADEYLNLVEADVVKEVKH